MKNKNATRVRFAPSPTGLMHLGNVRTALLNFLFAKNRAGTFVLRIEDTDPARNFDPEAKKIIEDLTWLGIDYDEGPEKGGPYTPYFQSQRQDTYKKRLQELIDKNLVYRCFCTSEELDKKRQRQIALKLPPRYDRTCLELSEEQIKQKLDKKMPFIWRFKLDHGTTLTVDDLAHGSITFDLKNFSDFPVTRQDGSFTFMFANLVDDIDMAITHVLRGEDHLSNTAGQVALYQAFNAPIPQFWHLPILASKEGKKLSKRDFGFALRDLKDAGYLPEAIANYLALIGGGKFDQEIMSVPELAQKINFEHINATGQVKYDLEKLKWLNQKWINKLEPAILLQKTLPFLQKKYSQALQMDQKKLIQILNIIKTDLNTLEDIAPALQFYFEEPTIKQDDITRYIPTDQLPKIREIVLEYLPLITNPKEFTKTIKTKAAEKKVPIKHLFWFLRLALMGHINGPGILELITILEPETSKKRIEKVLS